MTRKTGLKQLSGNSGQLKPLDRLLAEAKRQVSAMTPKQYEEMLTRQRESFVRAMTTPCEHGELDFEQCPKCRRRPLPSPPGASE